MRLHEIIEINDIGTDAILIESMEPYKNQLFTYYSNHYESEPVLMVCTVFNAAQYALIVPINEIHDAMAIYLEGDDCEQERELILSQSILFKDWL